jgi:hypothetical protein
MNDLHVNAWEPKKIKQGANGFYAYAVTKCSSRKGQEKE